MQILLPKKYVDTAEFFVLMCDARAIRLSYKTIKMHGVIYHVDIPPEESSVFTDEMVAQLKEFTIHD